MDYEVAGSLDAIRAVMQAVGCHRLLSKLLAANDNSKNQVYFGGDFQALNLLPSEEPVPYAGSHGEPIFKAALDFWWVSGGGQAAKAPHAQLILYPQYPEVRFSGFLRGCELAPTSLMNEQARLAGRVLFLGISTRGRLYAHVVPPESAAARAFSTLGNLPTQGVFHEIPLDPQSPLDSQVSLLRELCRVAGSGWIDSKRLTGEGALATCRGQNCGGYTLEAELGVTPNSYAEPDYLGWEVKQHAVRDFRRYRGGPLTLMTPEPTGGFYVDSGVVEFVRKYGYADRRGRPDRRNFGGIHVAGRLCPLTGLTLTLA